MESVLSELCSPMKLDRDRAVESLHQLLALLTPADTDALLTQAADTLDQPEATWHTRLGTLMCISTLMEARSAALPGDVLSRLVRLCDSHLSHDEARVRSATGGVLGALCRLHGRAIFETVQPTMTSLIVTSLQSSDEDEDKWETGSACSRDCADVFANTSSWTVLETCLRTLQTIVETAPLMVTEDLLELVLPSLRHRNRFVREAGHGCVAAFLPPEDAEPDGDIHGAYRFAPALAGAVAAGLDDNWSQVRMGASVAARRFICGLLPDQRGAHLPSLLPRICLNRYYVAEGVKLYNQRTWELMAGQTGRQLVQNYLSDVVDYYIAASEAANHAVREAACYCVAELTLKLPPEALQSHVTQLMDALIVCFQDDSWPVRDTACVAVGRLAAAFPDICRPYLPRLYPLLFANLHDNIPSVRQGGAEALAAVAAAYGDEAINIVTELMRQDLAAVKEQPAESARDNQLDGAATYGVVKKQRDNDPQLHTDQTMYSCGSLAPKMVAGGCSASHGFRRPLQPWEAADGSVRLVAELSAVSNGGTTVASLLPLVAEACTHRHFSHHLQLLETACRTLPGIARSIGKRPFKAHLELFLDSVFYATESENQLTAEAGRACIEQLSTYLGPGIFRGRVENHNPRYLGTLQRILPPSLP